MKPTPKSRSPYISACKPIEQFYDPLVTMEKQKKQVYNPSINKCCVQLFKQDEEDLSTLHSKPSNKGRGASSHSVCDDSILKKIIENTKGTKPKVSKKIQRYQFPQQSQQLYCFNNQYRLCYPQTPKFQVQLQSPFTKFNQDNKHNIEFLKSRCNKPVNSQYTILELNENPLDYMYNISKYFIGFALLMKQHDCIPQARMFMKMAMYTEPFNQKSWKKIIQLQQQQGYIHNAFIYSKTAFLFIPTQDLAKLYLNFGQKCGISVNALKGIIGYHHTIDFYEKNILVELAKLSLKYHNLNKGLKILYNNCCLGQFRLPVCSNVLYITRYLQNIGYEKQAIIILRRCFGKTMSKMEIYTNYLQMNIRKNNGNFNQELILEVESQIQYISNQNKYRVYLDIAELYFKKNNYIYKLYIDKAYYAVKSYCAAGTGMNKAFKHVYYSIIKWINAKPPMDLLNDQSQFQWNRYLYVNHHTLEFYQYTDWRLYLIYGLCRKYDILLNAIIKWPQAGRLIAEWLHSIRAEQKIDGVKILGIWRQKINLVPKSGELWCQGGRIYAQLGEYESAQKCFGAAIHFTPQYGDSFIECMRMLLIGNRYSQLLRLQHVHEYSRQLMMGYGFETFYGHVWNYLKINNVNDSKLSLKYIWNKALYSIKQHLYACSQSIKINNHISLLTAYPPYNQAYCNAHSPEIRSRLFSSYEQVQTKS